MHLLPGGVGVVPNACLATSCCDGCAVNEFLRSERIVSQAGPGSDNPFEQIEREVVVVETEVLG